MLKPPHAMQNLASLDTLVDLGHGVRAKAHVPDASIIYVEAGLGYWVGVTLDEALGLIAGRQVRPWGRGTAPGHSRDALDRCHQ